jgi:hypothetical protein
MLLCCRYSIAEDDYEGLALSLAIDHEPRFEAINRRAASLSLSNDGASMNGGDDGSYGPIGLDRIIDALPPDRRLN